MSQYSVKWNSLNNASNSLLSFSRATKVYSERVDSISNSLMLSPEVSGIIKKKLKAESSRLKTLSANIYKMSGTLIDISNLYKTTENKLLGEAKGISDEERFKPWEWKDTWKLIDSAGIIGSIVSSIGSLITGGVSWDNAFNTAKGVTKIIEKIAKAVPKSGASFDWKTLFGLNSPITDKTSTNFFGAIKDSVDDLKIGNAERVSEKVAVGAKWAGYAITAISTVYENFTDTSENNSTGRKIAESVGETAVKIGEGIAIGAAVTAICAAAGVAAPAVVIGGATVLVTWGVDKVCEYFTGKNFAEFASDTVLDTVRDFGQKAVDKVKSAAEAVGDAVEAVGDTIAGWWKKAFA